MARRSPISSSGSRRLFTSTAQKVHPYNRMGKPMRGGIRL